MKKEEDYKVVKHNSLVNAKGKYQYSVNQLKLICHLIAYAGTIRTASRFTSGHSAGVDSDS